MPKNKKLDLKLGIQTYQIQSNSDELCISSLTNIHFAVLGVPPLGSYCFFVFSFLCFFQRNVDFQYEMYTGYCMSYFVLIDERINHSDML